MTLATNLPTTTADLAAGHTAGHNATNTRVNEVAAEVNAHEAATTSVHGIADAAALATTAALTSGLAGKANTAHTHPVTDLTATGTRSSTTFLRGDNTWATPAGGGGGSGTVTSVTAADGTITVGGTATDPTVAVGTGIAQSKVTNLVSDLAAKQPLDSDLTTIAALTATTDNFIQSKASAWASRTPTQVAADLVTPLSSSLQPLDSDLTAIAAISPTNDDVIQRKAGAWTNRTPAQLKTDLVLVKGDVGLGNVDNTADTAKPVSTAQQTALDAKAIKLTVTAVKASAYSAAANEFVPVDTTAGNVTVTFPTAPADGTRVGVKHVVRGGTNTVGVALGGSDVFNVAGGSTSGSVTLLNQAAVFQYRATGAIWYATGDDIPLSQLDLRFQPLDSDLTTIAGLTATTDGILQSKSSAWTVRTPAQVAADTAAALFDLRYGLTVHAVGNSGTALTLDASSTGQVKTVTLTGNCTFTLTGAVSGQATMLELVLTQDGTGSRTVTWPASVKWAGGAPTLTTTASATDRIVLVSYNGGTTWYGDLIGKAYA